MEVSQGIVAFSQCRAQTGGVEAGGHEIGPEVVALGDGSHRSGEALIKGSPSRCQHATFCRGAI
jgi:hypothetical protein